MSLDTDEDVSSTEQYFTICTMHDPPVQVTLHIAQLRSLDIPVFTACRNFIESKSGYVLSIDACALREPWEIVFATFESGTRYAIDINYICDIRNIYNYLLAGDLDEFYEFASEQLEQLNTDYSAVSVECIQQLLAFHQIAYGYTPANSAEYDTEKLIPFEFPASSILAAQYIVLKNRIATACVENPLDTPLWEYLNYMCDNIEKVASLDETIDIHNCLITNNYKPSVDIFMSTQMTNWVCIKKVLSDKCVWSGGSLQMALDAHRIPETSDLDLWINDLQTVKKITRHISDVYEGKVYFVHNRSIVTVYIDKSYKPDEPKHPIQLIYVGDASNFYNTIRSFDMDYVRCFTNGKTINYTAECKQAHLTKQIRYTHKALSANRIHKAVERGFTIVSPHQVIPSKIKTTADYFFPDARIFPVEYNCKILSKFNTPSVVVTDPDQIGEIEPFVHGSPNDSYTFTEITREELNDRIVSEITLTDVRRAGRIFHIFNFNKIVVADLRNVKVFSSYKYTEGSTQTHLSVYKVDPAIIETVKRLEEHVQVLSKSHIECKRAGLSSKIKQIDIPESKQGLTVKITAFKTKIYNGVTGEEIKDDRIDWRHKTVSMTVEYQGIICVNKSSMCLIPHVSKIQVYPASFQHDVSGVIGIRVGGKRIGLSNTVDEIAELERYETDAMIPMEVAEDPTEDSED